MNVESAVGSGKPSAEQQAMLRDYEAALGTVRGARGLFLLLLVVSLLIHIAAFCAVRWGNVLEATRVAEQEVTSPEAPAVDTDETKTQEVARSKLVEESFRIALPLSEFVGQVSCVLLAICFFASAQICLAGGLGGIRGSLAAFFWTIVLFALLLPWAQRLSGVQIPGVFLTFSELDGLPKTFETALPEVLAYVRFLGYPVIALLIALVANARYGRGVRLVRRHLEARLHARPL
jgi:hypothetical protein